jgi:hypothetical protein
MNTPWGHTQQTETLGEGVVQVFTASHGGIRLSEERQALVHEAWAIDAPDMASRWYEEDCEWAIVALTFPECFEAADIDAAHKTARSWYPTSYEKVFGVRLTAGDSHKIAEREFYDAHRDDFVVTAAFGSWQDGVPAGMVGVVAYRGGRGPHRTGVESWFLVPEAEYDARGISFVIDVGRHEEVDDFTRRAAPAARRG